MCRLYGFRSNEPTRVECTLVHSQNALMVQSRTDLAGASHTHGWGIAAYSNGTPATFREAWPAFQNHHFRDAAARIYARTVVAHVRRATVGAARHENTHPFTDGTWSLAHNGTVPEFDWVRRRLLEAMRAEHRAAIRGDTDSEHLFRYAISLIDDGATALDAVRQVCADVVGWCRAVAPDASIGLNLLLSDGTSMVGSRWGRSLYHVERNGVRDCEICRYAHVRSVAPVADYRAVVIASEPLTAGEHWELVPEGSVFRVTPKFGIEIEQLGLADPPPEGKAAPPRPHLGVRTSLSDEFMTDHRAMMDGLADLRSLVLVDSADTDRIAAVADKVDTTSGSHIAFEEQHLYPALDAPIEMYCDHDTGRDVVVEAMRVGSELSCDDRSRMVAEIDRMLAHMDDCGRLLGDLEHLAPTVQSELEDRLLEWRERAPRWSRLPRRPWSAGEV